EKRRAIRNFT
ncbi:hypothetical protein NPIL_525771, partial [Nephila pilipes]